MLKQLTGHLLLSLFLQAKSCNPAYKQMIAVWVLQGHGGALIA